MNCTELIYICNNGVGKKNPISDWPTLLTEASKHKVIEFVARFIHQSSDDNIPVEVKNYLDGMYIQTLFRNLKIKQELEEILLSMNEAGINCIILKGIRLAERLYGDLGLRRSGDIDLYVEPGGLSNALEVLNKHGYQIDRDGPQTEKGNVRHHVNLTKNTANGIFLVELHFRLIPNTNYELNTEILWQRSISIAFGKTTVYDFAPADLLLYLCLHAALHRFQGLREILDIAKTLEVEGEKINWTDFINTTREFRVVHRVYLSLHYAVSLFGASVPKHVMEELRPSKVILSNITQECSKGELPQGISEFTRVLLKNDIFTIRDIVRLLFPSKKRMLLIYKLGPTAVFWLYYPRRWWDIVKKLIATRKSQSIPNQI